MTNEERDLIARYVARVGGAPQSGGFLPGSGPATPQAALPPIDHEADAFIAQQFQQYPEARYRITQTALVTEAALSEAQNRIQRLQWELEQTRQAAQQQQQQGGQQQGQSKGFFGSLFGGGQQAQGQQRPGGPWGNQAPQQGYGGYQPSSAPPQPTYSPGYQPGMFQRSGSGFLGSALTTAAGVAGGLVVGNALMNAFEGHHDSGGGMGGGMGGASGSPWSNDQGGGPFDGAGTTMTNDPTAGAAGGFSDPFAGGGESKGFDQPAPEQQTSWDQGGGSFDNSDNSGGGGMFDGGGGGGFDDNNS